MFTSYELARTGDWAFVLLFISLYLCVFSRSSSWTCWSNTCIYLQCENRFVRRVILFLSFRLLSSWLFMSNSSGVSIKAEDAYHTCATGPCSQFSVQSPSCSFAFVFIIFVILCSLLCVSVFHAWSIFFDYILLIFTRSLFLWMPFWPLYISFCFALSLLLCL